MTTRPRFKVPHVFVLLTLVIFVCSVFTWIVPSGQFQRETKVIEGQERTLLVPGTYQQVDKPFDDNIGWQRQRALRAGGPRRFRFPPVPGTGD